MATVQPHIVILVRTHQWPQYSHILMYWLEHTKQVASLKNKTPVAKALLGFSFLKGAAFGTGNDLQWVASMLAMAAPRHAAPKHPFLRNRGFHMGPVFRGRKSSHPKKQNPSSTKTLLGFSFLEAWQ